MGTCPSSSGCVFSAAVEPNMVKRLRFSSAFPYCRGGRHEDCAIRMRMQRDEPVSQGLLPDGSYGDYLGEAQGTMRARSGETRILVVDDSPIFATIAANTVRLRYPNSDVVQCHSFEEAEPELMAGGFSLIVSGNGLGGGRSVHDIRRLTTAPIVLFTGRPPAEADAPQGARIVSKGAGPEALRLAIESMLGT